MKIQKIFLVVLVQILLFANLAAQMNEQPDLSPELRKNAVEFLRQTIKEIPNLKSPENRQFFTIEAAELLWKYDEKESGAMFELAIKNFKQSLAKTNEAYKKAIAEAKKAQPINAELDYGANRYAANANAIAANRYYANSANMMGNTAIDSSFDEVGMMNELLQITNSRKKLIKSLIETDSYRAYQFIKETENLMPDTDNSFEVKSDIFFKRRITDKMLEKDEVDKAVEVARDALAKDVADGYLLTILGVYEKDAGQGTLLAEEVLQKLKISKAEGLDYYLLDLFFETAVETNGQTQPLLNAKSLAALAKLLGNSVLSEMDREYDLEPYEYAKKIEKYAPREALKILQKSKQRRKTNSSRSAANKIAANDPYFATNRPYPANYPGNIPYPGNFPGNSMGKAVNMSANSAANRPKPKTTAPPQIPEFPSIESDEFANKYILIEKLKAGEFTADERKKVIEAAKKHAFESNYWGFARPDRLILVVSELAKFSLASSDKEIADALMKEAEVYVRPETKTYLDYLGKLILAGGYSRHQSDKSFALMESMATVNEVIESAIKFGIFIDPGMYLIPNGEANAPLILGDWEFMSKFSTDNELPMFIQNLAQADFQRTIGLAEKFERNEVQIGAKLLILNSLLGDGEVFMRGLYY